MKKLAVSALALAAIASPASAAKRSFDIPSGAMSILTGATEVGGILFSNAAKSRFRINFSLPADYRAGSTVKLKMNLLSTESCTARFSIYFSVRARTGLPSVTSEAGFKFVNGGAIAFSAPGVVASKTIEIRPAAAFSGQKPGDYIGIVLQRDPAAVDDSCSDIVALLNATVRYTQK